MRAFLLVLVPLLATAGCLESSTVRSDTSCMNGVCQDSSVTCINGDCEVCVDGECAECAQEECDACRDGDCPAFERAGQARAAAEPPGDVDIQEAHDLTLGLSETTWSFEVARGATGHVYLFLRDLATGEMEVMGSACVAYEVDGPGHYAKSRQGSCGSGANLAISGSTNTAPQYFVAWDQLEEAHYTITASADDLQANELVIDIVVDNP